VKYSWRTRYPSEESAGQGEEGRIVSKPTGRMLAGGSRTPGAVAFGSPMDTARQCRSSHRKRVEASAYSPWMYRRRRPCAASASRPGPGALTCIRSTGAVAEGVSWITSSTDTGSSVTSCVVRNRQGVSSTATVPSSVPRGTGTGPRSARAWGRNWTTVVAGMGRR
jgi:hypothetical protein